MTVYAYDFVNNDSTVFGGGKEKDDHGTHVAGTIGAVGGNALGVVGFAGTSSCSPEIVEREFARLAQTLGTLHQTERRTAKQFAVRLPIQIGPILHLMALISLAGQAHARLPVSCFDRAEPKPSLPWWSRCQKHPCIARRSYKRAHFLWRNVPREDSLSDHR